MTGCSALKILFKLTLWHWIWKQFWLIWEAHQLLSLQWCQTCLKFIQLNLYMECLLINLRGVRGLVYSYIRGDKRICKIASDCPWSQQISIDDSPGSVLQVHVYIDVCCHPALNENHAIKEFVAYFKSNFGGPTMTCMNVCCGCFDHLHQTAP